MIESSLLRLIGQRISRNLMICYVLVQPAARVRMTSYSSYDRFASAMNVSIISFVQIT